MQNTSGQHRIDRIDNASLQVDVFPLSIVGPPRQDI